MATRDELVAAIDEGLWRPHWLAGFGTVWAALGFVGLLALLLAFRPALDAWLADLALGGLVGSAKPSDQVLGLGITAGFCGMMTVVGGAVLLRARGRAAAVRAALSGGSGSSGESAVTWIYREIATLPEGETHVLVFGLTSGQKVRATVPADRAEVLWSALREALPGASSGHDNDLERAFAVRPGLLVDKPRHVDAVQRLSGRSRAR